MDLALNNLESLICDKPKQLIIKQLIIKTKIRTFKYLLISKHHKIEKDLYKNTYLSKISKILIFAWIFNTYVWNNESFKRYSKIFCKNVLFFFLERINTLDLVDDLI